jgi:Lrp/AsnC family transcriptional regulator, leucine-responsive regulatory protein
MDLIDKKILCELDLNSRQALSRYAKILRINRNILNYRINKLERESIIKKYICFLDLGKLGYKTYKIYIKSLNDRKLEDLFEADMTNDNRVISLIKTEGSFDYSVVIAVKTLFEIDNFIVELENTYHSLIKEYSIYIIFYTKIFKLHKLLLGKSDADAKFESYSGEGMDQSIDDTDKKILNVLSQSGNLSIVEISKITGVTIDIIKYRLKQLAKEGIYSCRVTYNLGKLGYFHYIIMLQTGLMSKADEKRFFSWCAKKQNVLYYSKRIGTYNYEINVAIKDISDLNQFMSELKSEFSTVIKSVDTLVNSRYLKLNYVPF